MRHPRTPADSERETTSSTIAVRCPDSRLTAALRAWLDAGALRPPVPLAIDVEIVDILPPLRDDRPVFEQPSVEIHAGPPDDSVRIGWSIAPAQAELPAGSTTAYVRLSRAALPRLELCQRSFLTTVLIFLLRRAGWHHVHGATTITPLTQGWLLAGNAHAGKSTTTALLASLGWPVGTDDAAFLSREGDRVVVIAERRPIALREGAGMRVRALRGALDDQRRKMLYWPEELGGTWAPRVFPDVILFPSVGNTRTGAEPLGAAECLAELVRWSAWVILEPAFAQEHLDLLAALARQARSFRVTLGSDLFDRPTRLLELIT